MAVADPTLMTGRILELVASARAADPSLPLLIRGEPGVGKDTLARMIHTASPRQSQSFIKVNCAAQPADRCESDLFGHERGASPLAVRRKLGGFEVANHGTIYLDAIELLPPVLVPKLVHVLRTRATSHTGGHEFIPVDVRVIASSLPRATAEPYDELDQELRRLNAVEICIPPLRQRREEIPLFASFFMEQFNRRYRRDVRLCPDVFAEWQTHPWSSNLRELKDVVHRLVAGGTLSAVH